MPSLLVLAAGMGSRYGGLKQLDPMGPHGETVLDYSVFDAIRAGFDQVIFVIREDFSEAFKEGIGARFSSRIRVDYAFQRLDDLPAPYLPPADRAKPWGTAHAIRAARDLIKHPFAVINADDFYGRDAYVTACDFLRDNHGTDCGMVAYPLVNTLSDHGNVNRGICEASPEGWLEGVEELVKIACDESGEITGTGLDGKLRTLAPEAPASMNFWAFPPAFLMGLESEFLKFLSDHGDQPTGECYIPSVVDSLIRNGETRCKMLQTSASWFGVTYPEDKPHVVASIRELIAKGEYPERLA